VRGEVARLCARWAGHHAVGLSLAAEHRRGHGARMTACADGRGPVVATRGRRVEATPRPRGADRARCGGQHVVASGRGHPPGSAVLPHLRAWKRKAQMIPAPRLPFRRCSPDIRRFSWCLSRRTGRPCLRGQQGSRARSVPVPRDRAGPTRHRGFRCRTRLHPHRDDHRHPGQPPWRSHPRSEPVRPGRRGRRSRRRDRLARVCRRHLGQRHRPRPQRRFLPTLSRSPLRRRRFRHLQCWRIEHDYRELKDGLGLDHFEGRSWTGWHRHVTLPSVANGHHLLICLDTWRRSRWSGGSCGWCCCTMAGGPRSGGPLGPTVDRRARPVTYRSMPSTAIDRWRGPRSTGLGR
jgi:hypothetical protein